MRRYELVEITWVDSDHGSGWQVVSDMHKEQRSMLCKSVGLFFREDAETIQIVQSYGSEGTYEGQVSGILTIPKVAIRKRRRLS